MNLLENSYARFVNLDSRTDRLEHMTLGLQRVGIRAAKHRGMPFSEYTGNPKRVSGMVNGIPGVGGGTPGAVGCYISQMRVMLAALQAKKHAFVMEDDLIFCDDFHQRIAVIEKFLGKREWDILWLGGTVHITDANAPWWHPKLCRCKVLNQDCPRKDAEKTDDPNIFRTFGAFSTHAYIVNHTSIQKVLMMLNDEMPTSIGIDYSMIMRQPVLQTFMFLPGLVKQMDSQSSIGSGVTRFSSFAKLGPHWFQNRAQDSDPSTYVWNPAK